MRWILGLGIIGGTLAVFFSTRRGKRVARHIADHADELKVRARRVRRKAGEFRRQFDDVLDRAVG